MWLVIIADGEQEMTKKKGEQKPPEPYAVKVAAHRMCQEHVSSVCSVCQFLAVREEGVRKHSHCESGFFGESRAFGWIGAI